MFPYQAQDILDVLDACASDFTFPMLDNGYFYLAATRLALFRSETDWALTIEVFGFSPRSGMPDLYIGAFASLLTNRPKVEDYVSPEAHAIYLQNHPHDESQFLSNFEDADWIDGEAMKPNASFVRLRGQSIPLPPLANYAEKGIALEDPHQPQIFEFCRYIAAEKRSEVMATPKEQRWNLPPDLVKILELDEWHHPNLDLGEMPSENETFQQLAQVLVQDDVTLYRPTEHPNTHWSHWPDGGML